MTAAQCSCGFSEAGDETMTDHLLEAFTPADNRGSDGQVHEELAVPSLTCSCGFVAGSIAEMDGHFLRAFMPADAIGRDGRRHEPVMTSGAR